MYNEHVLLDLADKCDIYFENSLISKEVIIKKYMNFLISILKYDNSINITLHTGSICFDVISLFMAVILCIILDESNTESITNILSKNNMVIFKNERYRWKGIDYINGTKYILLEYDGKGKNGKGTKMIPFEKNINKIIPYYGRSNLTDGRGIRKKEDKRSEFLSFLLEKPQNVIPSFTSTSVVIVIEREKFEKLIKGFKIVYNQEKSIGLLDIVTASYFTNSREIQYGENPGKVEPALKATGKLDIARNLLLEKHGNRKVAFILLNDNVLLNGYSELIDIFGRKSIKFSHVAVDIKSTYVDKIIESFDNASVFACTKEFLHNNSKPSQVKNKYTIELEEQIENIINNKVIQHNIENDFLLNNYRKIIKILYEIKNADCNEIIKNKFLILSYSLLNFFITAVFTLELFEKIIEKDGYICNVLSPTSKFHILWDLASKLENIEHKCINIIEKLEELYQFLYKSCPKLDILKRYLKILYGKKIAIIVPKEYYINILKEDDTFKNENITIMTGNRFDDSKCYDKIFVIGYFEGKRFNVFRCNAAKEIIILLYNCENHKFFYKKQKDEIFKNNINNRFDLEQYDSVKKIIDENELYHFSLFDNIDKDLDDYINSISTFDVFNYNSALISNDRNTLTSEVYAIGEFANGEKILFSKYYKAVVYNPKRRKVSEVSVENLSVGDQLVFIKRDNYTRNLIDYIYDNLLEQGRLNEIVKEATIKAAHWKKVLLDYKERFNLSYKDIAIKLQELGSSLHEVTIRQWLAEDSHIIGPRDELTLFRIAELTQDMNLLNDTKNYFDACRIVRRKRKEILDLIGKAITDKLSGNNPPKDSILEYIYNNVETISEIYELDVLNILKEPINIPIKLVNKPIADWEDTI